MKPKRAFGNCEGCGRDRCAIWFIGSKLLCRKCRDSQRPTPATASTPDMTGHTGRTGEAIIKSAIEKAYHEGYSAHEKDYPRFTAWLESRAAHASEHHRFVPHGPDRKCRICGKPAHASEASSVRTHDFGEEIAATPSGGGEWSLVPVELNGYTHHFKVMEGDVLIYEGVTSESQGAHLIAAHNAALRDCGNDAKRLELLHDARAHLLWVINNLVLKSERGVAIHQLIQDIDAAMSGEQTDLGGTEGTSEATSESAIHAACFPATTENKT